MSALDAEDVRRFVEATERVERLEERLGAGPGGIGSGNGNFQLNLSGGGWYGVLVGFVAGAVLAVSVVVSIWASREFTRIDNRFNQESARIDSRFSDTKNTDDIQQAWIDKFKNNQKNQEKK